MVSSNLYSSGIARTNGVWVPERPVGSPQGNILDAWSSVCSHECTLPYRCVYSVHKAIPCSMSQRQFITNELAHIVHGWLRNAPLSVLYGVPSRRGSSPNPWPHFSEATIDNIWQHSNGILTMCLSGSTCADIVGLSFVTKMFTKKRGVVPL